MEKLNVRFNDGTKSEITSLAVMTGLSESVIARAALNRGLTRLINIIEMGSVKECLSVIETYEPAFNK